MAILGDTLPQIAAEKSGVIKKGTRLVMESQEPEVLKVFLEAASCAGVASLEVVNPQEIKETGFDGRNQTFSFGKYQGLSMQMLGIHQYENAAAAILAARAYLAMESEEKAQSTRTIEHSIRRGIANTRWQGRMEILRENPFLLVDGAHNSNGVEALADSLRRLFPGEKFHFIMGVMADKDYDKMVEALLPLALDFTTVTVENSRALQAKELAAFIEKLGIPAECGKLPDCLCPDDVSGREKTVAFGSLYFIGEIEALFHKRLQNNDKNPRL